MSTTVLTTARSRAARTSILAFVLALIGALVSVAPAQAAGSGTRTDPYWTGTAFRVGDWAVNMGRTDTDVWDVIAAENMFNEPPAAGWRYVMAPVTVRYLGAGHDTPWLSLDVELLGGDGRVYTPWGNDCGVVPQSDYDIDDLYYGASAWYNNCVAVPASAISGARWRVSQSFGSTEKFVRLVNPAPPAVTRNPVSVTAYGGFTAGFSAAGSGASALQWQTYYGGAWHDVAGATGWGLAVRAYPSYSGRLYRLRLANSVGAVYTSYARLTVRTVPTFTRLPQPVSSYVGQTAVFSAQTAGATSWQWQKYAAGTWANIAGATTGALRVPVSASTNNTLYRIIARGPYGSAISPYVALKVLGAPVITAQNRSVATDSSGWFRIGVVAERAVSYHWQVQDATGTWSWLPVTSAALEDFASAPTSYRVVVSNPAGSAISLPILVTPMY